MTYAPFKGKVYKYSNARKYIKFEEDYQDKYELLNQLEWRTINVPQRDVEEGFPNVDRNGAFGIMFESKFKIEEAGMYRFAITSDDGSIIWINDRRVIDSDCSNGMHMKDDTIALTADMYDIRIWYYQAYPMMFGIVFEREH